MAQKNLLDYDDLLVCTWELLTQREDILAGWQKRYQYILIDEFQDINKLQYEIIRLLAKPENNLFIVGDDDQSIYRFPWSQTRDYAAISEGLSGCPEDCAGL